jgi:hypothetical protein
MAARTAAGLDGADLERGERLVAVKELGVLAREDVVGDHAEPHRVAELPADREAHRSPNAARPEVKPSRVTADPSPWSVMSTRCR